jgi:hypothetical protein
MGMIDMFIPKDVAWKAEAAIKDMEAKRINAIRSILTNVDPAVVERVLQISHPAVSLRAGANAVSAMPKGGLLAEILTKVAEKLEG